MKNISKNINNSSIVVKAKKNHLYSHFFPHITGKCHTLISFYVSICLPTDLCRQCTTQ